MVSRKQLQIIGVNPDSNLKGFRGGIVAHLANGANQSSINCDETLKKIWRTGQLEAVTVRGRRYDVTVQPDNSAVS